MYIYVYICVCVHTYTPSHTHVYMFHRNNLIYVSLKYSKLTYIITHKNRGISRTPAASKMELFVTLVTLVNSFQTFTSITKNAILDVTSANSTSSSIHQ